MNEGCTKHVCIKKILKYLLDTYSLYPMNKDSTLWPGYLLSYASISMNTIQALHCDTLHSHVQFMLCAEASISKGCPDFGREAYLILEGRPRVKVIQLSMQETSQSSTSGHWSGLAESAASDNQDLRASNSRDAERQEASGRPLTPP